MEKITHRIRPATKILAEVTLIIAVVDYLLRFSTFSWKYIGRFSMVLAIFFTCLHVLVCMLDDRLPLFPLHKRKSLFIFIKPLDYIVLIFYIVNLIWIFIIPAQYGMGVAMAMREAGLLLIFGLYFPVAVLIRMGELTLKRMEKVVFFAVLALSIWHIAMWVITYYFPKMDYIAADKRYVSFYEYFMKWIGSHFSFILNYNTLIYDNNFIRVIQTNSVIMPIGLIMLLYKRRALRWWEYVCSIIFTFGIVTTLLKSMWIACVVSFAVILIGYIFLHKKYGPGRSKLPMVAMTVLITVIVLNMTWFQGLITSRMATGFITDSPTTQSQTTKTTNTKTTGTKTTSTTKITTTTTLSPMGTANLNSNIIKVDQIKYLLKKWEQSPLIGFGYGSYVDAEHIRSISSPYSYEMTFFALFMKLGILGFSSWILLIAAMVWHIVKHGKRDRWRMVLWLSLLINFAVTVQTNPLLLSPNGIGIVLLLLFESVWMEKSSADEPKEKTAVLNEVSL